MHVVFSNDSGDERSESERGDPVFWVFVQLDLLGAVLFRNGHVASPAQFDTLEIMAEHRKNAALFVATLLHSATVTHLQHLQTKSYAAHKALQKYYESIPDLVDNFAESYQGEYGLITDYPSDRHNATDPKMYLDRLADFVSEIRTVLPKDTPLQNTVDEIMSLINSTRYKLKFLS